MVNSERSIEDIQEEARKATEASVYTLTNPYTTRDEKIEIESWYQLPFETSGWAFLIGCILWSYGLINWWQAYLFAAGIGLFTAVCSWFLYSRKIIVFLKMTLGFPFIHWLIPVAVAVWLWISGSSMQAYFIVGNLVLFSFPVSFPAVMLNQIFSSKYHMNPKYALLKHVYGKTYEFE